MNWDMIICQRFNLEVSKSLEGLSEKNRRFLLEMINKYMKPEPHLEKKAGEGCSRAS